MRFSGQRQRHGIVLVITLLLGLLLFFWRLGSTGLVDETPPLFAAAARAMPQTGDWLVPRVNGLPRYDKPPLVYWLMGVIYALPGQERWNPLGTWAASFPSALASVAVMLGLVQTLLRWPQVPADGATIRPEVTALCAGLAYALSPLALLWGRIAVSDALFTALVAFTLLLLWRTYATEKGPWWSAWPVLGLAVLTKGPVAMVLVALTLALFAWLQGQPMELWRRIRPLRGLLITSLVAMPWYGLALQQEGRAFWDSFFGYHNLQRFAGVVNDHLQPWWYFAPVLVVASLPVTPLLLLGLVRAIGPARPGPWPTGPQPRALSLGRFSACWLLAVLLFFTAASTKLPSYWLPATPAAGVLIALAGQTGWRGDRAARWAWHSSLVLTLALAALMAAGPLWVPLISDPELPTMPAELLASHRLTIAAGCYSLALILGWLASQRHSPLRLLALQGPLVLFVPLVLIPLWGMGDHLRGQPVRKVAAVVTRLGNRGEPLAMVGILKPSLHYYSRQVVLYEGRTERGVVNLADRLRQEHRQGQVPSTPVQQPSVLVVIDHNTAAQAYWQGLGQEELARFDPYRLWRLDRRRLEARAEGLREKGVATTWWKPRPERY